MVCADGGRGRREMAPKCLDGSPTNIILSLGLCQASSQVKQNSIKVEVGCLCEAGGRGSTEVEQLQHMLTLFMSALEYSINENC